MAKLKVGLMCAKLPAMFVSHVRRFALTELLVVRPKLRKEEVFGTLEWC